MGFINLIYKYFILFTLFCCYGLFSADVNAVTYDKKKAYEAWATISQIEYREGIPTGLLHSMSLVETGTGLKGSILPWPYTVGLNSPGFKKITSKDELKNKLLYYSDLGFKNFTLKINNKTYKKIKSIDVILLSNTDAFNNVKLKPLHYSQHFSSKLNAKKFAVNLINNEFDNFDIGIMQINWRYHKNAFLSVVDALDAYNNINYAVSYLLKNKKNNNTWWKSVGMYHSRTPKYAKKYIKNVWNMYQLVHKSKS